jgi:osmotically-inducible protein OsmY
MISSDRDLLEPTRRGGTGRPNGLCEGRKDPRQEVVMADDDDRWERGRDYRERNLRPRRYGADYGWDEERYRRERDARRDEERPGWFEPSPGYYGGGMYGGGYGGYAGYGGRRDTWDERRRYRDDDRYGRGGRDDDRGFFDRATDEVASWFGDDDAERRRERDARMGDSGAQHHRGRGPRDYRRSDDRIREDINDRLTEDAYIDATEIAVTVQNGDVTLDGTVDKRMAKRRAEDIAEAVSGVGNVQNNLRVRQEQRTDAATATAMGVGLTGGTR